jgi:hypothetical protein
MGVAVGVVRHDPGMEFTFDAPLWRWTGESAWHFISLPQDVADEIEDSPVDRAGFGSVRVQVTLGPSTWSTSIFPDKGRATFLLPIKKQVRTREQLDEGDIAHVHLAIAS